MLFSQRICRGMRLGSGAVSVLLMLSACGDDSGSDASSTSGKGGSGGSEAAGKGGSGNAKAGDGGSTSAPAGRGGDIPKMQQDPNATAYHCVPKPGDEGGNARRGATCCGGLGRCTEPSDDTPASLPHDACTASPDLRCVPLQPTAAENDADGGMSNEGKYASCRVVLPGAPASFPDYEGRCLPSCFVQHSEFAARLSQSTCKQGETCAPCYSPLTGDATGNCSMFGDSPTESAPAGFAECSDGLGYCVPEFAAGMQASQLSQLTCKSGELCGPKAKVADPNACFEHCDAGAFGAGACVPMFLAANFASFLTTTGCSNGEVCAPCDILGTRSGVCD